MSLVVTTNQKPILEKTNKQKKPILDIQKIMRKGTKHNIIESHQATGDECKRRRKKQRRTMK